MSATVTIVIPTFRRVDGLKRATLSAFKQDYADPFEVLVVDNDPGASARSVTEELERAAPNHVTFHYVNEPAPGVANARNTALASTSAQFIAFLDDDQSAPENWLKTIMDAQSQFPAAVTFGPVHATLPETVTQHKKYLFKFFSRLLDAPTGHTDKSFGCGNSLMNMELIPPARPVFNVAMNETGGEDDILFSRIKHTGGKFCWAADAPVLEHVPTDRASLKYTLVRAIAYGQGPITEARMRTPPRWDIVLFWMFVGSIKATVNYLIYLIKWVIRSDDRANNLDETARGIGKIIWWKKLRFYGAARIASDSPTPPD